MTARPFQRILCAIGIHDWWHADVRIKGAWYRMCTCCAKTRYVEEEA